MSGEAEGTVESDATRAVAAEDAFGPTDALQTLTTWVLFVATVLAGVALAEPVATAGLGLAVDSSSVGSLRHLLVPFAGGLVVFFLLQRYDYGRVALQAAFLGYLAFMFGRVLIGAGVATAPLAFLPPLAVVVVLWRHPEWYVVNLVGVAFGAVIAAILGTSYGPLPALVALVGWAAYDAYAVYRSDAMETIAAAGLEMSIPGAFFVPDRLDASLREYRLSFEDDEATDGDTSDETDGPATDTTTADGDETDGPDFKILGVGDAMVPGFLVVSATWFLDATPVVAGLNWPALGALLGSLVGLAVLEVVVRRVGGAHAGLPALNATTIGGYLLGALVAGVPLATAVGV
ncbi:presenilin family intramembrane aspartyl protease PSH [Halobaculum sp. MBLA0147]|uniref:presenilin family intramembrane aspartyl protease PSH n=1 Tax=Halobaculum sp. MBLA0147 TaxID=3079934 RepID=UPI00352387A4